MLDVVSETMHSMGLVTNFKGSVFAVGPQGFIKVRRDLCVTP